MSGLILDVVIAALALLLLIFGVWRGMYKLIYGLISNVAALVVAILLASTVTSFVIDKTNIDDKLYEALDENLQNAIPADIDASNVAITLDGEGNYSIVYDVETYETVSDYLTAKGSSYSAIGGLVDSLINNDSVKAIINPEIGTEDAPSKSTSLAQVLSTMAIVYIMLALVFILLWIVAYIVMRLIMLLVKRVVHGTHLGYFFDKVLGLVLGAAFAMVFIWGSLAIIRLLGTYTWIIPANELIASSTLTKLLYEHNYIYDFLVKTSNLQETIAGLLGKFGLQS